MMANEQLVKNTLLYGITHFGTSILSFIMLPIYTYYFSPAEFGLWDLVLTTIALLSPLITLEIVSASYRWLLEENNRQEQEKIITTGAISIVRNLMIMNCVSIIILFLMPNDIPFVWETLILVNVSVISSFIQQCSRGLQFNKLFALIGIMQSIIVVIMNLIFMFGFNLRIEALFYSLIIAHVCTSLFASFRMNFWQYLKGMYSKSLMKQFLMYSLPIVPGAMSWWIMTMSDRYMIIYFLGIETNGIYAIANKIPAILILLNNIFFLAWKDNAITQFNSAEKNAHYSDVFKQFFRVMTSAVILLTLLTKPILELIIDQTFFHAWQYIGLLLIGSLFHTFSLFWSAGYHGAKKTNVIFVTSVIGAIVNIVVNLLFIPRIGLYAVGLSTITAFFVTWIVRIIYAKSHFNISLNYRDIIVFSIFIIIANIIPFQLNMNALIIVSGVVFVILTIINLKFILSIYRSILNLLSTRK